MVNLTPKMREYCEYVIEGLTNPEIAEKLNVSLITAKVNTSRAMRAYNVRNRVELALAYYKDKKMLEEYEYKEKENERSETLVKTLDKLRIAVEALKKYADSSNWKTDESGENCCWISNDGYEDAQEALAKIKENSDGSE